MIQNKAAVTDKTKQNIHLIFSPGLTFQKKVNRHDYKTLKKVSECLLFISLITIINLMIN